MHTNIFESTKIYNKYPMNQNSLLLLRYLKYQKARSQIPNTKKLLFL